MYRIGYLFDARPPDQTSSPLRALEENLRGLGYVEGKNLVVERRFAAFKYDRLPDLAAELVQLKPDVIVTSGNPAIGALKQATTSVPIVMAWAVDPVGAGLVTSLARPGGNITGSTLTTGPGFIAKQLEILNEIVPKLSRVAILRQPGRSGAETDALESAARKLGLTILFADVRTPNDIEGAFATMIRSRAGALLVLGGGTTWVSRQQIADLAVQNRLPGVHLLREYAEAGLLVTYGPDMVALFRRATTYIDKILKGARPADLPVEQPTKLELVINLKTAKALGLTIPPSLLLRADQVISEAAPLPPPLGPRPAPDPLHHLDRLGPRDVAGGEAGPSSPTGASISSRFWGGVMNEVLPGTPGCLRDLDVLTSAAGFFRKSRGNG